MEQSERGFDSKLIPLLREGVDIVKLILFKELKDHMDSSPSRNGNGENSLLIGAIINDLFGDQPSSGALADFSRSRQGEIDGLLRAFPLSFATMCIPLTDALRISVLCDFQEKGVDSSPLLERARKRGVLIADREMPMPHSFMDLVRRLGVSYGLLQPVAEKNGAD